MWTKIKEFFKSLFGGKKNEVVIPLTKEEVEAVVGTDIISDIVAADSEVLKNEVDKEIEESISKSEETDEEEKEKELLPFDVDDKEAIIEILRPIIKNINSDDAYTSFCNTILQSKTLKTYSSLSEDKKTLTIKLTQSKVFNELISSFISDHVVTMFKSSIDAEFLGKYEVTSDGGSIVITKIAKE